MEYIKKHPDADRLGLVGAPPIVFDPIFTPATSYLVSPKVFAFSTLATSFTAISKEYVVLLNPVLPLF